MKYKKYPTIIKLYYSSGVLPKEYFSSIPASTKHYWKKLCAAQFWQPDNAIADQDNMELARLVVQNRRLLQWLRMMAYLLNIYSRLFQRIVISKADFYKIAPVMKTAINYAKQTGINLFKRLPFSYKQYCAWTGSRHCSASTLTLCRKAHPLQLTIEEQKSILYYCNDKQFIHWPLSSIYCQLLKNEKLHCHISTFYKYCRLLHITRRQKRFRKLYTPLAAAAPLQMLHMDVSVFRTADNIKQYLYVIRDNYSRAILACKAATAYCSQIACNTLKEVLVQHGLIEKEGMLITDDGSENKGAVTEMLAKPGILWKKIIAQIDIRQSNSMVEAANKIIKHRFLHKQVIANIDELNKLLPNILHDYNNTPLVRLAAYTPAEVLAGKLPDFKRFEKQFFTARKKRVRANREFSCTDTC
jgi:hypothetical protein